MRRRGERERRRQLRLRGYAALAVSALAVVVGTAYAQGRFRDDLELSIAATGMADGLAPGSEVKFHGLTIGSVREISADGSDRRMTIRLERAQVAALSGRITARFVSSNIFGAPAMELTATGSGPIDTDQVISLAGSSGPAETETATAAVLHRSGRLTRVFDSAAARTLRDVLAEDPGLFAPSVEVTAAALRSAADSRRGPAGHYLRILGDVADGTARLEPELVRVLLSVLDQSEYFGDETNRARTRKAMSELTTRFMPAMTDVFGDHNVELTTVISVMVDIGMPFSMSYGSLPGAYQRLPQLMDHVREAFPRVDGRVQLQAQPSDGTLAQVARSVGIR